MSGVASRFIVLSLLAFALAAPVTTAFAADAEKPMPHFQQAAPAMYLTTEDLDKLEAMSVEDREAFFKERREEFSALSPEDQQKRRAEREAAFQSLSESDQAAVKERTEKIIDSLNTGTPRNPAAEKAAAQKEADAYVNSLSPEQKAKWDEIRKNSKKWDKKPKAKTSPDDAQ